MKQSLLFLAMLAAASVALFVWFGSSGEGSAGQSAQGGGIKVPGPAKAPSEAADLLPLAAEGDPQRAEQNAAEDRLAVAAQTVEPDAWIEGRVDLSEACEPDESLEVFAFDSSLSYARLASYLDRAQEGNVQEKWLNEHMLGRARVEVGGAFRLGVRGEHEELHLFLRGRYLYMPNTQPASSDSEEPLLLQPARGAWISGRLIAPAGSPPDTSLEAEIECQREIDAIEPTSRSSASGFDGKFLSDREGRFEMRALPTETDYRLLILSDDFAMAREALVDLKPCGQAQIDVRVSLGGDVFGHVVDDSGQGIEGAEVEALVQGRFFGFDDSAVREAKSDEQGKFELKALPPGKVNLRAKKRGWLESPKQSVAVPEEGRAGPETLELTRGASISGRVEWPDGTPATDLSVFVSFDPSHAGGMGAFNALRGGNSSSKTDELGNFRVTGLGKGPFVVKASAKPKIKGSPAPESQAEAGSEEPLEEFALAGDDDEERLRASAEGVEPGTEDLVLQLQAPVGLHGRVVDPEDQGVPKYDLRMVRPGGGAIGRMTGDKRTKSVENEDGSFFVGGLQAGRWELEIRAENLATAEPVVIDMPMETDNDPLVVRLIPTATVSGVVLSPDGSPVSEADVKTTRGQSGLEALMQGLGEWQRDVSTDEKGRFRITSLVPGPVSLSADHGDWAPGEEVALDLIGGEGIEDVELWLRVGGVLTGEVFDAAGEVAPGLMVSAQNTSTFASAVGTTDSRGSFRMEHLAPGKYQVVAMNIGGDPEGDDQEDQAANMLSGMKMTMADIVDGEETHVVLGGAPVDPVRVHGRVTSFGEPYAGALVSLYAEGKNPLDRMVFTTVGEDGSYEIDVEGHGKYVVSVGKMTGEAGQQNSVDFPTEIPEGPEFRLDLELPEGRISGRVFGPDGEPLPHSRITLTPDGVARSDSLLGGQYSELTTDADGRYDIPGLRPGVYRISAGGTSFLGMGNESPGGRLTLGGLRVEEKQWLQDVDFKLEAPGTLAVHVRDAAGAAAAGATVFVRDAEGRVVEAMSFRQTDGTGICSYTGLAPGEYTAIARRQQDSSEESQSVRVQSGQSTRLDLQLAEGAVLWVRFRVEGGEEVPAHVEVLDKEGRDVTGLLGLSDIQQLYSEGEFTSTEHRIGPVPPGKYRVRAWTDEGKTAKKNVLVRTGEKEKRFTLRLEEE